MSTQSPHVVAIVSTYRRTKELARLIASLQASHVPFFGMVVNDDFGDPELDEIVHRFGANAVCIHAPKDGRNSAARGWNRALDAALEEFGKQASHYMIIDDDAVLEPDALGLLLAGQGRSGAKSSLPSALSDEERFYVSYMLYERRWEEAKEKCRTRAEVLATFGDALPGAWLFQGLCHLMHRDVVSSGLRFDENFWMCGEDLDFSVRVAEAWKSVYVPQAFARHLCGAPLNPASLRNSNYLKRLSFLQNVTFMGYWRPYGRKLRGRYLDFVRGKGLWPAYRQLFTDFGFNRHTLWDLAWILFHAIIRGEASNQSSGQALRQRRRNYLVERRHDGT